MEDKNELVFFMITKDEKWHYIAVKSVYKFILGIPSNNDGDYYCIQYILSFRTENKLKSHVCIYMCVSVCLCLCVFLCKNHDY